MNIKNLSSTYLLALLYIYKRSLVEASEKYLIPENLLKDVYEDVKDILVKDEYRLKIIEELLLRGEEPENISEAIYWRDFEHLVAKYFEENNYMVLANYRVKKPRREIDLIAYRTSNLFCIDCKNWNISPTSSIMNNIVLKQMERCCFLRNEERFSKYDVYPILVVMRGEKYLFFDDVPVIPINSLRDFIHKLEYLLIKNKIRRLSC